jgi:hypothetical protein
MPCQQKRISALFSGTYFPTFYRKNAKLTPVLPDTEVIKAVCNGDHVKAIIRAVPPSEQYDAERMWIRVTSAQPNWLEGTLDSPKREYWARC